VVSVTVERLTTSRGELVLRAADGHFEIVSDGTFLMDTRDGRSERELVAAALADAPRPARVLVGGLGVGFSLAEALRTPGVTAVTVVEIEPAVVRWNRTHLGTDLDDPRLTVVVADLADFLVAGDDRYEAVCLDVDNGPEWTVTSANAALYGDPGLAAVDRRLAPGGVLAVWSAAASQAFEARLRERYRTVEVRRVPVARGEPDVVWVARDPVRQGGPGRPADRAQPAGPGGPGGPGRTGRDREGPGDRAGPGGPGGPGRTGRDREGRAGPGGPGGTGRGGYPARPHDGDDRATGRIAYRVDRRPVDRVTGRTA
jgi:hypothetical protein